MRFSEHFGVTLTSDDDWFDPLLNSDTPLYIDPFLVFEDEQPFWADARKDTLEFFSLALDYVKLSGGRKTSPHWLKAQRMMSFPEPKEFALGLSMGHPEGSGAGDVYAAKMTSALGVLAGIGVTEIEHIQTFSLFCKGPGVDRISDIFCNILKSRFIQYTAEVSTRHGVLTESVPVKHLSWSRTTGRWNSDRVELPSSPAFTGGVLLAPKRFMKDIPLVAPDLFWSWVDDTAGPALRDELNYELNVALSKSEKVAAGLESARRHPRLALEYVHEVAEARHTAYDVETDPDLRVRWAEAGVSAASHLPPLSQPASEADFYEWLEGVTLEFQHEVEHGSLWKALWDEDRVKHRREDIVQAVASAMFGAYCGAAHVIMSREVDMGRGPVDFKFTAGWQRRALIEVKLMDSSKFFSGAAKQLPQYLKTEKIEFGIYLCVGFADRDFEPFRVKRVEDTLSALSKAKGIKMKAIYVDARHTNKKSASTI
jgi:hypothetical protein